MTTFTAPQITQLTTQITGQSLGRLATMGKTMARLERAFTDRVGEQYADRLAEVLGAADFDAAKERLTFILAGDTEVADDAAARRAEENTNVDADERADFEALRAEHHAARRAANKAAFDAAPATVEKPVKTSKNAVMLAMVRDPAGATEAEICAALGWKACRATLGRVVDKAGLKLTASKDEATGRNRYFIAA